MPSDISMPSIVFEDDAICVVNKPAGMVTNDAETVRGETVQSWFKDHWIPGQAGNDESEFQKKGGVVHRLDKDTSGIMVLAKTEEAYEGLKKQFLERTTIKKYLALVHGNLKELTGILSTPIDRHPKVRHKFAVTGDLSRTSITEWTLVKRYPEYDLVELTPHTGRTHQLRVHMQHLGHPIVSDPIYGFRKKVKEDLLICPRLFLHAKELSFVHPVSLEKMTFEAELSKELQNVLDSRSSRE